MIYTDKQYGVSKAQLAKLREALVAAKTRTSDQAWLKQAEIDALTNQIADIEAELAEYDLLRLARLRSRRPMPLRNCRACWCRRELPAA